jgi:PAS domain S-box-containing protein
VTKAPSPRRPRDWNFLAGGGDMGERIRAFDWGSTPVGTPDKWPQSLRTAVRIMLTTGHPMFIWWGPELIQFYNDAYRATMGPERHPSALGQRGRECWAEIWDIIGPQIEDVMAGKGNTWNVDALVPVTRHGRREDVWWTYSYGPIDLEDRVGGVLVVCTDVTEQHRARERLEDTVARLAAERDQLWQASRELLAAVTPEGVLRSVNPAWTRVLGWSRQEIEGRHFRDFVHPDDQAPTARAVAQAQRDALYSFDNRYRHVDGTWRWINWTAASEQGTVFAVGRDVTDERKQAQALSRAEEALRQSAKMEAVGQLTGGLAHDFNNLLQGIIGSLGLIQKLVELGRTAEVPRYVGTAMNSANRAAALTHRLLAFSRRQPLDPRPLDVNQLVSSMEELLRRTLGESIVLRLDLADTPPNTLCDHNQLESAILNLVVNARDAMPDGGTLTIGTHVTELDAAQARPQGIAPGEYVCVTVADTGVGMSADVMKHAFEPFFTTKPLGQGTGLGLSMIYGFARQSGGSATLRSEGGRGTTVTLLLPRDERDAAPPEAQAEKAAPWRHAGGTALVVEDDPVVLRLVSEALRELGYEVVEASDGFSGMEALRAAPALDLLVSDVGLPGLNGRQIADAGLQMLPALKVVLMTGYAEKAALANLPMGSGMEILVKPFTLDAFTERVRKLVQPA